MSVPKLEAGELGDVPTVDLGEQRVKGSKSLLQTSPNTPNIV